MIEYRLANIDDLEELVKVRMDFLTDAKNIRNDDEKEEMIAANKEFLKSNILNDTFAAWIAVDKNDNNRIVATSGVSFYIFPPNTFAPTGKVAYISNMFTYPEFRDQGIATKLFSLTVDEAKKRGCKKILLNATDMGKPIYEKYGFKYASDDMVYYV